MATFQDQVQGLTQLTVGTTPTTGELTQFLTDGAKEVINRIISINPMEIPKFTISTTDSANNGVTVKGQVLSVVREHDSATILRPCAPMDPMLRYEATDTTSLSYRSKYNPGFYNLNGKIFLVPVSATGNNGAIVTQVGYPTVAFGDSSIASGASDYKFFTGVTATLATPTVLTKTSHTFVNGDIVKLSGFTQATELNGITGIVESVAGNNFSIDGVYVDGAAETTGGTVETVVGGFPDEYEYLVVLYASIKAIGAAMGNEKISLVGVAPDTPVLDAVTFAGPTLNITATNPTAISLTTVEYTGLSSDEDTGAVSDVVHTTVSISDATQPVYNGDGTVVGLADGTLTVDMQDTPLGVTDLSVNAVPPDAPVLQDITYSPIGSSAASAPSVTATTVTATTVGASPTVSFTVVGAGATIGQTATPPPYDNTIASSALTEANDFIDNNEDVELATGKLQEVQSLIQNELHEFNQKNVEYQAGIQEAIGEFQGQNQANIQQAQLDMQQILQQAQYTAQKNSEQAQYTAQKNTQDQQATLQVELQNKNLEQQKLLQNAINEMQSIINDNNSKISEYQAGLSEYQAEVGAEVQEWQANTNKDLQVWQQTNAMALQEHSARMQDALNVFNEQNVEYQAEVQEKIQQAQINNQENLQNMQKALQIAIRDADRSQEHQIQERVQDVQAIIADNQRKISQYQTESAHYATQVNEDVQSFQVNLEKAVQDMQSTVANNQSLLSKYQAEVASYQAEAAIEIQEQTQKMQEYTVLRTQLQNDYEMGITSLGIRREQRAEA